MIGAIVAVSENNVIGLHGTLPWRYSADLKRFKALTIGSTIIMGRHTWTSLPKKPLPQRRNIVITRNPIPEVDCFSSIGQALETCDDDIWFIGGSRIFAEAFQYCDILDITHIPETVDHPDAVLMPEIDTTRWRAGETVVNQDDPRLRHTRYTRIKQESSKCI